MSIIDDIIQFNSKFVADKKYIPYISEKTPKKRLAILSCMDSRLTELLPAALNIKNGEAKIIKNAGAIISHPYGSVMRSLIVAIYSLGVRDIMVIGHTDCGVEKLDGNKIIAEMKSLGINTNNAADIDDAGIPCNCSPDLNKWLRGFESVEESVRESVKMIKSHPLIPADITVRGFIMDVSTGKITEY